MDKEFVGWSHPEGSGQRFKVPMVIGDKCVLQGSTLGLKLFTTFINNHIRDRNECSLSRFVGDINLNDVAATSEGWDAKQRDLDKLEKWVPGNLIRFNKIKCKMLHLGLCSPLVPDMKPGDELEIT